MGKGYLKVKVRVFCAEYILTIVYCKSEHKKGINTGI